MLDIGDVPISKTVVVKHVTGRQDCHKYMLSQKGPLT